MKIQKRVNVILNNISAMKKYNKPQIIAKNLPTGSYAAGCPSKGTGKDCVLFFFDPANGGCRSCERTK